MIVLFRALAVLVLVVAANSASASPPPESAPVAPSEPPSWLRDLSERASMRPLSDPLGKRFVARATTGIALIPASAPLYGLGWFTMGARFGEIGTLPGPGLAVAGTIGAGIALERAHLDLRYRGVHVSPTAGRVGFVLVGLGTLASLGSAVPSADPILDHRTGRILYVTGAGLSLLAVVPLAIQTDQVRRGYLRAQQSPREPTGATFTPWIDPVTRSVGVTGAF